VPHNHGDGSVIVDVDSDRATGARGLDLGGM
jgi:hypothetical protein